MSASCPVKDKFSKYQIERYHFLHELRMVRAKERVQGKSFKHEEKKWQCEMRASRREHYK